MFPKVLDLSSRDAYRDSLAKLRGIRWNEEFEDWMAVAHEANYDRAIRCSALCVGSFRFYRQIPITALFREWRTCTELFKVEQITAIFGFVPIEWEYPDSLYFLRASVDDHHGSGLYFVTGPEIEVEAVLKLTSTAQTTLPRATAADHFGQEISYRWGWPNPKSYRPYDIFGGVIGRSPLLNALAYQMRQIRPRR